MRALLLAGGIGTRLRPLTFTVPKCLVEIHGRPLLDYWLDLLLNGKCDRVLINTHWLADKVRSHIEASPYCDRLDLAHEETLLGTGGTILANRCYFGDRAFMVAHADNLVSFDIDRFFHAHASRPPNCIVTMLSFRTDDPRSCGILEVDENNVVRAFHEKVANPPGNLANGAVYIFEPEVMDMIAAHRRPVVDLSTEILPFLTERILAVESDGYHRDIGNLESMRLAQAEFANVARRHQCGA